MENEEVKEPNVPRPSSLVSRGKLRNRLNPANPLPKTPRSDGYSSAFKRAIKYNNKDISTNHTNDIVGAGESAFDDDEYDNNNTIDVERVDDTTKASVADSIVENNHQKASTIMSFTGNDKGGNRGGDSRRNKLMNSRIPSSATTINNNTNHSKRGSGVNKGKIVRYDSTVMGGGLTVINSKSDHNINSMQPQQQQQQYTMTPGRKGVGGAMIPAPPLPKNSTTTAIVHPDYTTATNPSNSYNRNNAITQADFERRLMELAQGQVDFCYVQTAPGDPYLLQVIDKPLDAMKNDSNNNGSSSSSSSSRKDYMTISQHGVVRSWIDTGECLSFKGKL